VAYKEGFSSKGDKSSFVKRRFKNCPKDNFIPGGITSLTISHMPTKGRVPGGLQTVYHTVVARVLTFARRRVGWTHFARLTISRLSGAGAPL